MEKTKDINENCFDVIRWICTLTVFLGHFLTHFNARNEILYGIAYFVRGVPVFFFLSGLFITQSLNCYDTEAFLKKRILRIFPELWICVLFNLLIILYFKWGSYNLKDIVVYLITQLTAFQFYTGTWLRSYGVGVPNGALWTITVDIQFYIIAIFLIKWMNNWRPKTWIVAMLTMMSLDRLFESAKGFMPVIMYKLLQCSLVSFIWIFLLGMCFFHYKKELTPVLAKYKWLVLMVYIIWQYVVPGEVVSLFEGVRYNLVTTVLLLVLVAGLGVSYNFRLKNDYSYSFYLYHMVVINLLIETVVKIHPFSNNELVVLFMIAVVGITFLAFLSKKYAGPKLSLQIERMLHTKN